MPVSMRRSEARKRIRERVIERLKANIAPGAALGSVRQIIDDRYRGSIQTPSIAVIRESASVDQRRNHETHRYVLSIVSMVDSGNPSEAMDAAEDLADDAASIVIAGRDLGLEFVDDVHYVRSIPASDPQTNQPRAAALAEIAVIYTILPE